MVPLPRPKVIRVPVHSSPIFFAVKLATGNTVKCRVFLNVGNFFKDFIEFIAILLLFYVLDFGSQACGILAPPSRGMEPAPPALERKALTTGPPGEVPTVF